MIFNKDHTQDIINLIWDRDVYYIVAAGKDAPSKKEVVNFGKQYSISFPKEYIAHATGELGGLYIEVKEELWPRAKEYDVGPFWSFLYGVYSFAFSNEAPEWMRIKVAAEDFKAMGHNVIPVLKIIGDADVYCVNQQGNIVQYRHETDEFEEIDENFFSLLKREILDLDDRKNKKINNT